MEFWQQVHNAQDESFSCHLASGGFTDSLSFSADCARFRHDYLIIYLHKGTGQVCLNKVWVPIGAGSLLFYRPMEFQEYRFEPEKGRELFWVYFDHITEHDLSTKTEIPRVNLFKLVDSLEIHSVFRKVIEELVSPKPGKALMLSLYTGLLLVLISRNAAACPIPEKHRERNSQDAVRAVCRDIEDNPSSFVKLEEYASRCSLSKTQFIKLFRQITGETPIVFRQRIRLEKAEEMLLTTDLSVQDIATRVGFRDALYFSRLFHNKNGLPPRDYRKRFATFMPNQSK